MDSDPAACDTGEGDTGRVRPPKPMRQPCARPRTSRHLSGAPAPVLLRRRAVRSLVQHAARVQGADGLIPRLGPLTARAVPRASSRDRHGLRRSTACSARLDLVLSTASGTMRFSQVCDGGVCRHILPAGAACSGYDCFRRWIDPTCSCLVHGGRCMSVACLLHRASCMLQATRRMLYGARCMLYACMHYACIWRARRMARRGVGRETTARILHVASRLLPPCVGPAEHSL
jgi:hypothetical protein